MDGDCAPLAELAPRAMQQGAALMVDDAHGFGVLGARGRGTLEMLDVRADIQIGTFGKEAGEAGACVAGDDDLVEYLIQHARRWVVSTGAPPGISTAARSGWKAGGGEGGVRRGR